MTAASPCHRKRPPSPRHLRGGSSHQGRGRSSRLRLPHESRPGQARAASCRRFRELRCVPPLARGPTLPPSPAPATTLPDTSTKQDNSSGSPGRPPSTVFVNAFRHFAKLAEIFPVMWNTSLTIAPNGATICAHGGVRAPDEAASHRPPTQLECTPQARGQRRLTGPAHPAVRRPDALACAFRSISPAHFRCG